MSIKESDTSAPTNAKEVNLLISTLVFVEHLLLVNKVPRETEKELKSTLEVTNDSTFEVQTNVADVYPMFYKCFLSLQSPHP